MTGLATDRHDDRCILKVKSGASGRPYLAADIPEETVGPYVKTFRQLVDENEFASCIDRKLNRDGPGFHLTAVSPDEYSTIAGKSIEETEVGLHLLGLGKAAAGQDRAWFIVVESPDIMRLRTTLGLAAKDLHITLGFCEQDVHDVDKSRTSLVWPRE